MHVEDLVVLVDDNDVPTGRLEEKLEAHRRGDLHRAFSVLLSDGTGRLLLQRRALAKYHSGGLWTNTCCGHPQPGEAVSAAAERRLMEEMGIACRLTPLFRTHYRAAVSNGLIENEVVHVFGGQFEGVPIPDPSEVEDWRWETLQAIGEDVARRAELYTVWFSKYVTEFTSILTDMERQGPRRWPAT
jgi:isopentenyl-diphosphate Delta-isomerase